MDIYLQNNTKNVYNKNMEKLLIIDGNSLANRAFYALPLLSNSSGEFSNAVYGFTNILVKFILEQSPNYIAVAFDHSRHTFRTDMFKDYKGTRKETPIELRSQFPLLKQLLSTMGIKYFEEDGIEADDIIGTIAKHSSCQNIILSGDRDLLQLIDSNTQVWLTKKGITDVQKVDENNIQTLYGVTPSQIVDLKSLMGDASDNIPGVAGIGEKTALSLIQKYQNLDGVYAHIDEIGGKLHEKLEIGKDSACLSYRLATIKTDCKINTDKNNFTYNFPFDENVKQFFEKYEFKSLLKREELFNIKKQEKVIKKTKKIIEIKEINELKNILNQEIKTFSFNFLNDFHFCINNGDEYFVSAQQNLFSLINFDNFFELINNILINEKINKIIYNKKAHLYLFDKKIQIKGDIFDIELASYLLNAGTKNSETFDVYEYPTKKREMQNQLTSSGLDFVYSSIELPLCDVLFGMENNGFYLDEKVLCTLSKQYTEELNDLTQNIYNFAGKEFNIKSPKQVAEVLFDELSLSDKGNKKHKTDIDVLTSIQYQHDIVPLIIRYRKIQKLLSTYVEVYQKLIAQNGNVIHTVFNQTLTSTGRLSSSEPNLQNIPVRDSEGKNLRKMFISRFDGGELISADYNQIELRILAHLSQDEHLVNAYKSGKDIHRATASKIFGIPYENITSEQRQTAKAVNFGIVYGISAFGLSNQINVSPTKAQMFIDRYFLEFPKVKEYMQNSVQFARQNGYSKTMYGRIRHIGELSSSNFNIRSFGERVAMNAPIQGSASDIIKLAMIEVSKCLQKQNLCAKLILQIHDELIIDAPKEEITTIKTILKDCMENIATLSIPLIVDIHNGKTWFDTK